MYTSFNTLSELLDPFRDVVVKLFLGLVGIVLFLLINVALVCLALVAVNSLLVLKLTGDLLAGLLGELLGLLKLTTVLCGYDLN